MKSYRNALAYTYDCLQYSNPFYVRLPKCIPLCQKSPLNIPPLRWYAFNVDNISILTLLSSFFKHSLNKVRSTFSISVAFQLLTLSAMDIAEYLLKKLLIQEKLYFAYLWIKSRFVWKHVGPSCTRITTKTSICARSLE